MSKSPYEVLGVSKGASPEAIRRQYLARVREFPPETHPEEFEAIREAYEVLSAPEPLTEDEGLLSSLVDGDEEMGRLMEAGQWKAVLSKVKAKPEPYRSMIQSIAYFHQGRWDSHVRARERVLKQVSPASMPVEGVAVVLAQYRALYLDEADPPRAEDALALYDRYRDIPQLFKRLWMDYSDILAALGRREETIALVEPMLPGPDDPYDPDNGELLVIWIAFLESLGKKDLLKRHQSRAVRYWRKANPEQMALFKESAEDLLELSLENQNLQMARDFAEIMSLVDRKDQDAKKRLWDLNEQLAADQELARLNDDPRIFPAVAIDAVNLFDDLMGWDHEGSMELVADTLTSMDEREWYVAGVARLKKAYPTLYRLFRDDWEASVVELTKGMNREQRRRLLR